ncbi:hypothetical protein Q6350_06630 [Isoptericola sp. b515]|uniref:hypothetical protein n=1 Tax=Isoptericola sp. b515 TaxID=3064652 RepID=UPI002713A333|nr:hypothetical protein [Isoptericola sp. b515]MDO8148104.1 hypothetical protein [Isoptericola sp. b515]
MAPLREPGHRVTSAIVRRYAPQGATHGPHPEQPQHRAAAATAATSGRRTVLVAGIAFVLGAAVGSAATWSALGAEDEPPSAAAPPPAASGSQLSAAYDSCGAVDGIRLEDGGTTLMLDVQGSDDYSGATFDDLACVLSELGTPARVTELMGTTRAIDGHQSDTWDRFTATWSYHPDSGLDLIVVED